MSGGPNSSDALSVLHQLSSNPQMLSQLQNVLSLLNNNSNNNNNGAAEDDDTFGYASGHSQEPSSSSLSSPAATLGQPQTRLPPSRHASARGARPSGLQAAAPAPITHTSATVPLAKYEQMLQRGKAAEDAAEMWAQRFRTSEADVEQLTRDARLLEEKLEEQRRLYKQLEVKRETDLVNAERIYAAALRRQDEVHEEAVRQLLKAHQLQQTAARYEATVQHKMRSGLSTATTPVNVRHSTATTTGSGAYVKRERSEAEVDSGAKYQRVEERRRQANMSGSSKSHSGGVPSTTASTWKERSEQLMLKEDDEHDLDNGERRRVQRRAAAVAQTAAFSSSLATGTRSRYQSDEKLPAPQSLSRVQSAKSGSERRPRATAGRRRTPLTPSLTNADRISASRSPVPRDERYTSRHATAAHTLLPTGSWKLDTPTPPNTTTATHTHNNMAGDDGRGVSPRPVTTAAARARYQSQPEDVAPYKDGGPARTEERFVSQYASTTMNTNNNNTATTTVAKTATKSGGLVQQKMAAARLPAPTVADASAPPLSPRPASLSYSAPTGAMNISVGAMSGTSSGVAGGPTRSPSPVNPKRGPPMARRFIFTGLKDDDITRLQSAIDTLGDDARVLDAGQDAPPPFETTHIVMHGTPRSVKAMCGVVSSRWLVSPEYVYNSLKVGFWLDEYEEGGLRFFPSPVKCQRFLLTMEHDDIRTKLEQVIEYGGGEVVKQKSLSSSGTRGVAQDVVVVSCGDDLLRFATQVRS